VTDKDPVVTETCYFACDIEKNKPVMFLVLITAEKNIMCN